MTSLRLARLVAGVAVTIAILATGMLTAACGGNKSNAPSSTTTTTTTTTTATTTTTTEGAGTITEFTPGSTIVLKETSGPRSYHFGKKVTYVTRGGKELDEDTVRTRVKVGAPVHVHYVGDGDNMMVDRVILDED